MPRVFVHDSREWRNLGEEAWLVSWSELRPNVMISEGGEIDFDSDLIEQCARVESEAKAREYAKHVNPEKLFFGVVNIQKQVVDWFVEEDRVAEWRDVGAQIEVEP